MLSTAGRDQSNTGNVTDNPGDTNSDTVSNIDIDKSDPSAPTASTNPASPQDASGNWFKDT